MLGTMQLVARFCKTRYSMWFRCFKKHLSGLGDKCLGLGVEVQVAAELGKMLGRWRGKSLNIPPLELPQQKASERDSLTPLRLEAWLRLQGSRDLAEGWCAWCPMTPPIPDCRN